MSTPLYPAPVRHPGGGLAPCTNNGFVRGAVSTACLSAFQTHGNKDGLDQRRLLRHALQGGTALAAGECAAAAWARRDYSRMLTAAAFGAAGVLLIERLLGSKPSKTEKTQ